MSRRIVIAGCVVLVCACSSAEEQDIDLQSHYEKTVSEGGPNPAATVVRVSNRGNCGLTLTLESYTSDGRPWLRVSPASATIDPGNSINLSLTFDVIETAMAPGNYVGTIMLTGVCTTNGRPARGSPRAVSVNLRVTALSASISLDNSTVGVDTAPVADVWAPIAENTLRAGRSSATAVWTGREMWVYGGLDTSTATLGVGGKYDAVLDEWLNMPGRDSPGQRYLHTAVWTGSEMIVWGGRTGLNSTTVVNTGGALGSAWRSISTTNAPVARSGHTAVWTGQEMIVFGGFDATTALATGGRYNPATDTWTALPTGANAPSARANHTALWTGKEMIVWGGENASGNMRTDGARYDPATDKWKSMDSSGPARSFLMSAWTGSKWLLYGGTDGVNTLADGMIYSPADDSWSDLPADTQRRSDFTSGAWTGREWIVWGGTSGRRYNPQTNLWAAVTTTGQPSARQAQVGVWTGTSMVLYGGVGGTGTDGFVYR